MAHAQIYRGTWEELSLSAHLYRGRTDLTLIVPLDTNPSAPLTDTEKEEARVSAIHAGLGSLTSEVSLEQSATEDPFLETLQEIVERTRQISPKPDTRDWLREGREGGMFGDEQTG